MSGRTEGGSYGVEEFSRYDLRLRSLDRGPDDPISVCCMARCETAASWSVWLHTPEWGEGNSGATYVRCHMHAMILLRLHADAAIRNEAAARVKVAAQPSCIHRDSGFRSGSQPMSVDEKSKVAVYLTAEECDFTRRAVDHYRRAIEIVGVEIAIDDPDATFDDRPLIRRAIDLSLRFAAAFSAALDAKKALG